MTSTDMTSTREERVAAGAAWLDEHRPGWADDINLGMLRMGSTEWCILGQVAKAATDSRHAEFGHLVGGTWEGPPRPFLDECLAAMGMAARLLDDEATNLGFEIAADESYHQLEEHWVNEVHDRRRT